MERRDFLKGAGAMGLLSGLGACGRLDTVERAAFDAWLYLLPLIEMAQARRRMALQHLAVGHPIGANRFGHARALLTPQSRAVTRPNVDTLYSAAWLDLSRGPVTITIPPTGARYISVAVMDMYTNNNVVFGTRTTGGEGGKFVLAGPDHTAGDAVKIQTNQAWALARILVDGDDDLAAVHTIQNELQIEGEATQDLEAYAERTSPWQDYFASAQRLAAANPPPEADRELLRRAQLIGFHLNRPYDASRLSPEVAAKVERGIAEAMQVVRRPGSPTLIDGWAYPPPHLGDFGQDYLLRARVALGYLAALPCAEAMYLTALGENMTGLFSGDEAYVLRIPANLPVSSFWSLTAYGATDDGQFFLIDNPIGRYAIGDRTQGLKRASNGDVEIFIARSAPADASNWLPAPQSGSYGLTFRAYLPGEAFLNGDFTLPPVLRA